MLGSSEKWLVIQIWNIKFHFLICTAWNSHQSLLYYYLYNSGSLVIFLRINFHSQGATTMYTFLPPPSVAHSLFLFLFHLTAQHSEHPSPCRLRLYLSILDFFLEKCQRIQVGRQLGLMQSQRDLGLIITNCQAWACP